MRVCYCSHLQFGTCSICAHCICLASGGSWAPSWTAGGFCRTRCSLQMQLWHLHCKHLHFCILHRRNRQCLQLMCMKTYMCPACWVALDIQLFLLFVPCRMIAASSGLLTRALYPNLPPAATAATIALTPFRCGVRRRNK